MTEAGFSLGGTRRRSERREKNSPEVLDLLVDPGSLQGAAEKPLLRLKAAGRRKKYNVRTQSAYSCSCVHADITFINVES